MIHDLVAAVYKDGYRIELEFDDGLGLKEMREYRTHIWNEAITYLEQRIDGSLLREYMSPSEGRNPRTITQAYRSLVDSIQNRQGMPNSIGSLDRLSGVLCAFDPKAVLASYPDGWSDLFAAIEHDVRPASRMDKENNHNFWVIFCKACLSAAKYLTRFETLADFLRYVQDFDTNPNTRPALPLLIGHEVFGVKFALACDFLKEIGFSNYSKPDTHLTDIFTGLGLCEGAPLDVFRAVTEMSVDVRETPYAVDKVFWLIGSGNLYRHGRTFHTDKQEYVRIALSKWQEK